MPPHKAVCKRLYTTRLYLLTVDYLSVTIRSKAVKSGVVDSDPVHSGALQYSIDRGDVSSRGERRPMRTMMNKNCTNKQREMLKDYGVTYNDALKVVSRTDGHM